MSDLMRRPLSLTVTLGGSCRGAGAAAAARCSPRCGRRGPCIEVHILDEHNNRTIAGVMSQDIPLGDWIAETVATLGLDYRRDDNGVWTRPLTIDDVI